MKKSIAVLAIILNAILGICQAPSIQWEKSYGGSASDGWWGNIAQTKDNGYIIAGTARSNDGDVVGYHGGIGGDFWIIKTSSIGSIQWQRCYGGTQSDQAKYIQQTRDGGYIIFGNADSNDGDLVGTTFGSKNWIIKTDSVGVIKWQKIAAYNNGNIQQTSDGGYIYSTQTGIVKIDSLGGLKWQNSAGAINCVQQTTDHGYIAAATASNCVASVSGNDVLVYKFDSLGVSNWQRCLSGNGLDIARFVQPTTDGGYLVVGKTASNNLIGYHPNVGGGTTDDAWVVKLNNLGIIQWQKCLGGIGDEDSWSAQNTSDGGYLIGGSASSNDGDVTGNHGRDYWVVKLTNTGNILWQKCLGGTGIDEGKFAMETADGGYIVVGYSYSQDGDVSASHGSADVWVVKLGPAVGIEENESSTAIKIIPNPSNGEFKFDGLESESKIVITDIMGNIVAEFINTKQDQTISLRDYPSGIYFYNILAKKRQSGKLLKY